MTVTPTSWFNPYQGAQALDLDGFNPGSVKQSFVSTIGTTYQLSFAYANNGSGGTFGGTRTADVTVTDAGGAILLSSSVSHTGSTPREMNYQMFTATFVADTATTTLQFTSTDPSNSNDGIVLDAVSVRKFRRKFRPRDWITHSTRRGIVRVADSRLAKNQNKKVRNPLTFVGVSNTKQGRYSLKLGTFRFRRIHPHMRSLTDDTLTAYGFPSH